ncbi:MAG: glycosyltransferase [Thermoleophilaceae bacterium]
MRLAVYNDDVCRRADGALWTDRTFPTFVGRLCPEADRVVFVARLDPAAERWHFRLPDELELAPLPYYRSLAGFTGVLRSAAGSARVFWRVLDDVDVVWLLGPHPLALLFALLARVRRREVVLGVRQELREYARRRHPGRPVVRIAAGVLERAWQRLARRTAVVVVGPELARRYASARRLLELQLSVVSERALEGPGVVDRRTYDGELQILSVGRIEAEKNPLLLAEVLALLRAEERRWKLVVCGTGPMAPDLELRLRELGVDGAAELKGYVPVDGGLLDLYRESHVFLHVSWTEGIPQVLFECFATRVPLVATAVGGVAAAAGDAALLVPPGDAAAAARAVARVANEHELRTRLTEAGARRVRTVEQEARRTARFLQAASGGGSEASARTS